MRQFAAEYALLQASGSLLRYRFYWRERNFAILDLFLPLRGRALFAFLHIMLLYIVLISPTRNCPLPLSLSPVACRLGHHVRDPRATRVTDVTSPSRRWWAAASCELNANRRWSRRLAIIAQMRRLDGSFRNYRRSHIPSPVIVSHTSELRSRSSRSVNTFASTADGRRRSSLEGSEEFRVFHGPDNYPCDFGRPPRRLWERSSLSDIT